MTDSFDSQHRPFELRQWAELGLPPIFSETISPDMPLAAQLQQQNDFLWAMMNNSPNVGMWCVDPDYCYLFFNRLHQKWMKERHDAEIQLGHSILGYLTKPESAEQIKAYIDRALTGEVVNDIQAPGDADADQSFFDSVYAPLCNNQGQVIGVTVAVSDVSAAKKAEERLKKAYEELEQRIAKRTAELQQTTEELQGQISDRGLYEQTIRESEERFRSTFEQSATAIVLTDQSLSIQYGNQAFSQLTGYPIEEMMEQSLFTLLAIPNDTMTPFWQQSPLKPGHVWQSETIMERKDGRSNDVSMSITAVYDAQENLLEYVVQLNNVSLRRQLERAQQQFITNTSHELRTPLTNIRLYLQLLEKRPENQSKYLQVLNREVGRLQTLLGDIIEIAALTASGGASSWQSVSVEAVVQSAVALFRRAASAKELSLELAPIETDMPSVSGDPARLAQGLSEILENAVNFTPPGGKINVVVGALEKDGRQWVSMAVQDTGPGIPADEQPYVFERFFRGAMSEGGNIPGTGLGLSIAQAIIKAHGGRILVESLVGMGSVFTVLLPINQ